MLAFRGLVYTLVPSGAICVFLAGTGWIGDEGADRPLLAIGLLLLWAAGRCVLTVRRDPATLTAKAEHAVESYARGDTDLPTARQRLLGIRMHPHTPRSMLPKVADLDEELLELAMERGDLDNAKNQAG